MFAPPSLAVRTQKRQFLPYSFTATPAPLSSPHETARRPKPRNGPHRVVMLGFPQAQVLDVTGPLEVFSRTARWLTEHRGGRPPPYVTEFVAARAGPVVMSNGLRLIAARRYRECGMPTRCSLPAASAGSQRPRTARCSIGSRHRRRAFSASGRSATVQCCSRRRGCLTGVLPRPTGPISTASRRWRRGRAWTAMRFTCGRATSTRRQASRRAWTSRWPWSNRTTARPSRSRLRRSSCCSSRGRAVSRSSAAISRRRSATTCSASWSSGCWRIRVQTSRSRVSRGA